MFYSADTSRENINVGLFSDNSLRFLGGGEITLIDIGNFLYTLGMDVSVIDDSNSTDLERIDETRLRNLLKAKYAPTSYVAQGILKFVYHPMPPATALASHKVNLISTHRIPHIKYLKSVSNLSSKVVLCFHGIGVQDKWPANPIIWLYQIYMRYAVRRVSEIINVSSNLYIQVPAESTASLLVRSGINRDRVFTIPSGIDPMRCEVGRNDDKFIILFMARMNDLQKGIKRFRDIVCELDKIAPDIEIIALGSGPDETLLKEIDHKSFHYLGYVQDDIKTTMLENANLMIITSNMEPFSLVCNEGLFSGLPVVSTPAAGPASMLSSIPDAGKVSGFSKKKIVADVISYFEQWRENKDDYSRRKVLRSSLAREKYNLETMKRNYLNLVERLSSCLE
ncbi:MAG: glycosyltransferase family 4 protein [Candidatus Thermoplasmatota archaeon]|nr:glycosyltransferase family 4 protein [Candidatus Thermoplasmatota archaeon]